MAGVLSAPALPVRAVPRLSAALQLDLKPLVAEEISRGILFPAFAFCFCLGAVLYFTAPDEPGLAGPVLAALGLGVLAFRVRRRIAAFSLVLLLCAIMCGFAISVLRAHLFVTPVVALPTTTLSVSGWVEAIEPRNSGFRLTLALTAGGNALPPRIRVTSRQAGSITTGDHVSLRVRLLPPPDVALPGGYDFARDIVFGGLGATGFVVGEIRRQSSDKPASWGLLLRQRLDQARLSVSQRIRAAVSGEEGAVADALVTGRRHGVSEETNDRFRQAGVYHLLSISGFHMTLVAALVFALVRGGLALIPPVALRFPVKGWAACVALLVSGLYLLLSGAEVATQRSYVMIFVVLLAIMLGRDAMTLRTLSLAALVVLVIAPEAVMGPSFQMSFAATAVLVAGVQHLRPKIELLAMQHHTLGRVLLFCMRGVMGLFITSVAATLATAPFSAFHFHTMHLSGVLGNLLAAPIIELATMPLEILALLLWPFGYDLPVWWLVGQTVTLFMAMTRLVADHAGSAIGIKAFSGDALVLMACGLVVMAGCATRLRLFGFAPFVVGVILALRTVQPDLLIDAQGKTVVMRDETGHFALVSRKATAFTLQQWLSADADKRKPDQVLDGATRRCDMKGCAVPLAGGGFVAVLDQGEVTRDDCAEARLVVADHKPDWSGCRALVISRADLQHTGAMALYRTADGRLIQKSSHSSAGRRIWMKPPPQSPEASPLSPPFQGPEGLDLRLDQ